MSNGRATERSGNHKLSARPLTARLRVSRINLDKAWKTEENDLWAELHARPLTESSPQGRRLLRFARQHGIRGNGLNDFKKRHGIITEAEAVTRSWRAYNEWIKH